MDTRGCPLTFIHGPTEHTQSYSHMWICAALIIMHTKISNTDTDNIALFIQLNSNCWTLLPTFLQEYLNSSLLVPFTSVQKIPWDHVTKNLHHMFVKNKRGRQNYKTRTIAVSMPHLLLSNAFLSEILLSKKLWLIDWIEKVKNKYKFYQLYCISTRRVTLFFF